MKLRCDLNVNGGARKLLLIAGPNEPEEHLALKLAAYVMFWDHDPIAAANANTPALAQYDFMPDLMALDDAGDIKLWVECGSTTMNKLTKLTRRIPEGRGRVIVLKETPRDAQRLRKEVDASHDKPRRVEILHFPEGGFRAWRAALAEKTDFYGEGSELMINGVANETPVLLELARL